MSNVLYTLGQRVRLKPFDNGDEIVPEEFGKVCCNTFDDDDTTIVSVDEQYRTDMRADDGLREVTLDQIEAA